jgi:endonuclease/exonuclease/phosphatase family metal-dependent hydrolase
VTTGAPFKVLQFNIQFGQIWDDSDPDKAPIDLDRTIAEIRTHDADIILLQEVEQGWPGGAQLEPPPNFTQLRAALRGYDSFFSYPRSDPRELPFGIGLAIFSKTPLADTVREDLPSPAIEFDFNGVTTTPTDRLLIGASTVLAGRRLRILNAHLLAFFMLNSSSEKNPAQRRLVAERLQASEGPTLLGGDFNVSRHASLVRQFGRAGYKTVQSKKVTWRRRPYVLDHIFYSRHLKPLRHEVRPTMASDHHVLAAEFDFV